MSKQLLYGNEARQKLKEGMAAAVKAIKPTIGPISRHVILDKKFGAPQVVNDAVEVTKELEFKDPFENMGAKCVHAICDKTSDKAGDGTATAALLLEALYQAGLRRLSAGVNPVALKEGLSRGLDTVLESLDQKRKKVQKREEYEYVATVAAAHNPVLGRLIAEAIEKVGNEGLVTVEEGKTAQTTLDFVQGMQFDKGYVSPYFITNVEKLTCEYEDVYILLHDKKISNVQDLVPLLEEVVQTGRPLLVITEEVEGEALTALVVNKLQGVLRVVAVKAPGFGDRRKALLQDIAVITGGQYISEDMGFKLENVKLEHLGRAKKIVVEKERTILMEGAGKETEIRSQAERIRKQIKETTSDYDREKLQERLSKLTGGAAVLKVGASTEVAMKELKGIVQNAVHAAVAAREEGVVPGGGISYLGALGKLEALSLQGEAQEGVQILIEALKQPLMAMAENAGYRGNVVVAELLERWKKTPAETGVVGFDVRTGDYVALEERGIIDPVKVLNMALSQAVSMARVLLTSDTLITDLKDKKKAVTGSVV